MKHFFKTSTFLIALLFLSVLLSPSKSVQAAGTRTLEQCKTVFDATYYYNKYPDVASVYGNDSEALWRHFAEHGFHESRTCSAADELLKSESDLAISSTQPKVWTPAYTGTETVLATYTTQYTAGIPRETNLLVATSRINGVVVQPGAEFSFSNTILPRTKENGYVAAPVIAGKKYVQGLGGGVCQVSSTLYAAMLTCGLPATERHPHSLKSSYVPVGYDATISGNSKDLKFINTYTRSLRIDATCGEGNMTVTLVLL